MMEDAVVSFVTIAFVVKDAWSVVMEFACFAFIALTFQLILAEQCWISHYFASR